MTGTTDSSRDAAYFEALYQANPDPWNFAGSTYEQRKYQLTIAALADRHFVSALEIGCSIGVLTRHLAARCAALLGVDIVDSALTAARARCADLRHVAFANLTIPDQWPGGQKFDLIVISEMLYFLTATDITRLATRVAASLLPGGMVLLVNYTEQIDEPCSGDQAAEIFIAATRSQLSPTLQQRHEKFRIDRLQSGP
jgi:2-polyprenyl-3-methyl-5-hydroxy-6-metoxy-1,4-benzoquinol methylase